MTDQQGERCPECTYYAGITEEEFKASRAGFVKSPPTAEQMERVRSDGGDPDYTAPFTEAPSTEPAAVGHEHEWGERLPTEFQPCAHPYDTDCDARRFPRSGGTVYVPESATAVGHSCSSEDCVCYHRGIIAEHEGRASLTLYRGTTPVDTEPILIDKRFPCGCHVAMTVLPDGTIQGGGFSHHEAADTEALRALLTRWLARHRGESGLHASDGYDLAVATEDALATGDRHDD